MNALETTALTEKQHEKVQVCENKLVRRIVGAKRSDKRKFMNANVGWSEGKF